MTMLDFPLKASLFFSVLSFILSLHAGSKIMRCLCGRVDKSKRSDFAFRMSLWCVLVGVATLLDLVRGSVVCSVLHGATVIGSISDILVSFTFFIQSVGR